MVLRNDILDYSYSIYDPGSIGDGLTFTTDSAFNTAVESEFTVLIRCRMNVSFVALSTAGRLIAYKDFGTTPLDRNFEVFGNQTTNALHARICSGSATETIATSVDGNYVYNNQWVVVGMVYKQGARFGVFLNSDITEVVPGINLVMNAGNAHIGGFGDTLGTKSSTTWSNVTILDTALTSDEIATYIKTDQIPAGVTKLIELKPNETGLIAGTVEDVTGNGYDGTLVGNAEYSTITSKKKRRTPQNFSHSIQTTTNAADEVNFGNDSSLVLTGDFSIALWLKGHNLMQTANSHGIFGKRTNASNREFTCFYQGSDNTILFKVSTTGGTSATPITTPGNELLDNKWYRLVVTRSGNDFTMYLNGSIIQTGTASTVIGDTSANVTLGSWAADGGNNWDGLLTQFYINKGYAWVQADVDNDYYDGIQTTGGGTLGLDTKMTDGAGATVTDSSGLGNNGALEGAAAWSTRTP